MEMRLISMHIDENNVRRAQLRFQYRKVLTRPPDVSEDDWADDVEVSNATLTVDVEVAHTYRIGALYEVEPKLIHKTTV